MNEEAELGNLAPVQAAFVEVLGSSGELAKGILACRFTLRSTVLVWKLIYFFLVEGSV